MTEMLPQSRGVRLQRGGHKHQVDVALRGNHFVYRVVNPGVYTRLGKSPVPGNLGLIS